LYINIQNILAHYSFGSEMYFKEKTTNNLKFVKIRISVWECKLNCANEDWL